MAATLVDRFMSKREVLGSIIDGSVPPAQMQAILEELQTINAQNTLCDEKQCAQMAATADFVGHALAMWKVVPTEGWRLQLRAALVVMRRIDQSRN